MKDDSYGTTYREALKHSMSEPAHRESRFKPQNRRSRPHYENLRVLLWCFATFALGCVLTLWYGLWNRGAIKAPIIQGSANSFQITGIPKEIRK